MDLGNYLKDKIGIFLLHISCMTGVNFYLKIVGCMHSAIILLLVAWLFILVVYYSINFYQRKKYFDNIKKKMDKLDQRYLIAEVMEPSWHLEDQLYHDILHKSSKSVIEKIHQLEREQMEYKEYIEAWIHEVKSPLTVMNLLCENLWYSNNTMNTAAVQKQEEIMAGSQKEVKKKINEIQYEIEKVEEQVERVLYFARMEQSYKDYFIHRIDLRKVIVKAIQKDKLLFRQNQMQIDLKIDTEFVATDEKWLYFLLHQIFSNAVKYKKEIESKIEIRAERKENSLQLEIEDNGCGIKKEEINRIFEKGFSGSNGRKTDNSTGIGLYLCKKLCKKLGMGIIAESEEHIYTRIILIFPDSLMLSFKNER